MNTPSNLLARLRRSPQQRWADRIAETEARAEQADRYAATLEMLGSARATRYRVKASDLRARAVRMRSCPNGGRS